LRLGQNGTLDYTIYGDSYGLDPPIYSPSKVNVTNGDQIYYHTTDSSGHNVSPFKPSDVTVLFEPRSELLDYDGHVLVHAKISVSPTAEPGTYWIGFVPGGCSEIPIFPLDVEK
jgi:hypothetical protein